MKFAILYKDRKYGSLKKYFTKHMNDAMVDMNLVLSLLERPRNLMLYNSHTTGSAYYSLVSVHKSILSGKYEMYHYYISNKFDELNIDTKMKLLKKYVEWLIGLWDYYDFIQSYLMSNIIDTKGKFISEFKSIKPVREYPATIYAWLYSFYSLINAGLCCHDSFNLVFFDMEKYMLWIDFLRLSLLPVFGKKVERELYKYLTGEMSEKKAKLIEPYILFLIKDNIPIGYYFNSESYHKDTAIRVLTDAEWDFIFNHIDNYTVMKW